MSSDCAAHLARTIKILSKLSLPLTLGVFHSENTLRLKDRIIPITIEKSPSLVPGMARSIQHDPAKCMDLVQSCSNMTKSVGGASTKQAASIAEAPQGWLGNSEPLPGYPASVELLACENWVIGRRSFSHVP